MIANNIAHYPSIPTIDITTPPPSSAVSVNCSTVMSNIITPSKVPSISIHDTTSFNREITQSNNPLSKLSKQSSTISATQFSLQYNLEKMESTPSTAINQTKLLEPKVPSDNFSNCYELFRFSLNSVASGNPLACKYTQPLNSLTTCYSTSTSNIQHAIPNDLITLATMEPETFKSNHSKLVSLRIHDMHTPVRYTPNHSPHLNAYHQHTDSTLISSSPLAIRSKIVGIVSTPTSRSNSTDLRKSPCITSENSSCRSPSRDDSTPKPSLSKIQKPKHQHGKKKSSSSSSTDEEDGKKFNTGTWTRLEHEQFLKGLEEVGKNWKLISENYVQTRKRTQIASHAQKWFLKLAEMKKGGVDSSPDELYL